MKEESTGTDGASTATLTETPPAESTATQRSPPDGGGVVTQDAKITFDDRDFGYSVAVAGSRAAIGALHGLSDAPAGDTYVFNRADGEWRLEAKLIPNEWPQHSQFAFSLAMDGSTVLVGTRPKSEETTPGRAYVFERTGGSWTQQAKLTADDGHNYLGESVALDESTALVGAPHIPDAEVGGSAYVFERSAGSWSQQAKLAPDDGDRAGSFGDAVALDGSTALIGALNDDNPNGKMAGSAYVFERTAGSWTQQATLTADDGDSDDWFGGSVALDGSTALVGADSDEEPNGEKAGSAYIFERTDGTWTQQAKLAAADGGRGDGFGASVALAGTTALVGAPGDEYWKNPEIEGAGTAYMFKRTDGTWTQQAKLAADDAVYGDAFSHSIALDGSTALMATASVEVQTGRAYVFRLGDEEEAN